MENFALSNMHKCMNFFIWADGDRQPRRQSRLLTILLGMKFLWKPFDGNGITAFIQIQNE